MSDGLEENPSEKEDVDTSLVRYASNPIGFATEVLGLKVLTSDQERILSSVLHHPETNVPSCHGAGKTKIGAVCALWWVFAVGGLCITTAPTERQVKELLWGEIRQMYDAAKSRLEGERGVMFVKLTESARAYGFTSRSNDSNSFQGVHSDRLLVIEDEACGISPEIDDGAMSCATGADNRILRIGNPITPSTPFEFACAQSAIRVSAWNHPNVYWAYEPNDEGLHRLKPEVAAAVIGEDGRVRPQSVWPSWCPKDKIPGAISINWIEDVRSRKGEGSAFWQSRVEGLFPRDSEESIIPRSWFLAARLRYDTEPEKWNTEASKHEWRHGEDVGDGKDAHALASFRGSVLYFGRSLPTKGDREDITRAATFAKRRLAECPGVIAIDRMGVGSGVLAILLEQDLDAIGFAWGSSPRDSSQFANLKAEQWWLLREAFRKDEIAIAPLGEAEDELMEDLAATYWEETSQGKIRIEDKDKTKKRLGRSPNLGDACVMAYHAKRPKKRAALPTVTFNTY